MGYNGMHGETQQMRDAAAAITAAKPVAPNWGVSAIPATMAGVQKVNAGCTTATQRGTGFVADVAEGFDLFSEILRLCANDYDQADNTGAQNIARSTAASLEQAQKVDQLHEGRYFDYVPHYNPRGNTDFQLPPDSWGVK